MPQCKKCNSHFSYKVVINGKLRIMSKRKFCLICSPFGQHNTRKLHLVTDASRCEACGANVTRHRRFCSACWAKMLGIQIKIAAIAYKGGKCMECGRVVSAAAFEFHHRDPEEKEFSFGGCANRNLQSIKQELDKCDLLCVECHRAKHWIPDTILIEYALAHPLDFHNLGG